MIISRIWRLYKYLWIEEFCFKIIEKCKLEMEWEWFSLRIKIFEELEKVVVKMF